MSLDQESSDIGVLDDGPTDSAAPGTTERTRRSLVQGRVATTGSARRTALAVAGGTLLLALLVLGAVGVGRYVETFWVYRGFPPPARPTVVVIGSGRAQRSLPVYPGSVSTITVTSPALGGSRLRVIVYLPPGYQRDVGTRYPVLYLLHGFPGSPAQFVNVGDVAVESDLLLAEHRIRPMILIMPTGSTGFFVDDEWANSIRAHNDWETYVARDVVGVIDRRYRTIPTGPGRGIGGLSEGGYAALNIAIHHPGEFDLIEGWSPYFTADRSPALFGSNQRLLAYNSPAYEISHVAGQLRADHVFIWLYAGSSDYTDQMTRAFVARLGALHLKSAFSVHPGHHNWKLWRSMIANSLTAASRSFGHD